jgi:hypothetical protein
MHGGVGGRGCKVPSYPDLGEMHKFFVWGIRQQYQQEDRNQRFPMIRNERKSLIEITNDQCRSIY